MAAQEEPPATQSSADAKDQPTATPPTVTVTGVRLARKISTDKNIADDTLRTKLATGALTATGAVDTWTYRIIILALTLIGVISLVFALWLTLTGKNTETTTTAAHDTTPATVVTVPSSAPDIFLSLGSTAVGALAGLVSAKKLGANGNSPAAADTE